MSGVMAKAGSCFGDDEMAGAIASTSEKGKAAQ
jgi:hypothetical protein